MVSVAPAKTEVRIELPPLHTGRDGTGGQVAIANHEARFKVIVCGRRWGKTTYGVWKCVRAAIEGGRTWWVAPTYKIAQEGWLILRPLVMQMPQKAYELREGDRMVRFTGGGSVEIRSADTIGSLRGAGLDGVVLDEFASCREGTWAEELRPALADHRGWADFIGTPKGRNWGWRLFEYAEKAPRWERWRKPTVDNPYISLEEIEQARAETLPDIFEQEYEADFGASQLQVYSNFDRNFHSWRREIPKFDLLFGGLDFGGTTIGSHKSAGVLAGYEARRDILIILKHFEESGANIAERQLEWMATAEMEVNRQQSNLGVRRRLQTTWRADKTQIGFIQLMRGAGLHVLPSRGGKDSVTRGIQLVQRRFEVRGDGLARMYIDPRLTGVADAIERYRYPELREGDDVVQSPNPLKVNDDTVDALRYLDEGVDAMITGDPQKLFSRELVAVQ